MQSSPPLSEDSAAQAGSRMPTRVFLLAMAAFIVYGSLFPFDFTAQAKPLAQLFDLSEIFAKRSDAIDNFLLFVPFGIGLHAHYRSTGARLLAGAAGVLLLGVGLQLAQLYLPSRTASLADVVWNTVGMGAGLAAAAWVRPWVAARLAGTAASRDGFALVLLLLWFFYESFPFVPTLDLGLLRAHIKTVVMAPPFEPMRLLQHLLAAAMAGVAVQRMQWLRTPQLALCAAAGASLFLEVFVAYGQLRRETMLGIVLGMLLAWWLAARPRSVEARAVLALALAALLLTVLTPYRGQQADGGFTWTPFSSLLWQGGTRELVPATYEALAIAALLWSGTRGFAAFARAPFAWAGLVLLLVGMLEMLRFTVAGFHGDSTTVFMALVLAPAAAVLGAPAAPARAAHLPAAAPAAAPATAPARPAWWPLVVVLLVLTLCMWLLVKSPAVPYNLQKLFGEHALMGAAFFAVALLWLGSGPWLAVQLVQRRLASAQRAWPLLPLLLLGLALPSYLLLNLATPDIMLNKIIGAPDLYRRVVEDLAWGDAWRATFLSVPHALANGAERLLRFLALYSLFMAPLMLSMLAMGRSMERGARIAFGAMLLLPVWVLAKLVVLDWAITDNLTELVSQGGELWIALNVFLFGAFSCALGAWATRRRAWPLLALATVAVLAASWGLLNLGIEDAVLNNGRLFSGVQFLLGKNRTEILSPAVLCARWCALYMGAAVVVAAGMRLAMGWRPLPAPPPRRRRTGAQPA